MPLALGQGVIKLNPTRLCDIPPPSSKQSPSQTNPSQTKYIAPSKRTVTEPTIETIDLNNDKTFPSLGNIITSDMNQKKNFKQVIDLFKKGDSEEFDTLIKDEMDYLNITPSQLENSGWYIVPQYTGPKTSIYL